MTTGDMIRRDMRAFWTPFLFGAAAVLLYVGHHEFGSRVLEHHERHGLFEQPLPIQLAFGLVLAGGGVMIVWHQILRPIQSLTRTLGAPRAHRVLRELAFSALLWSPIFAGIILFASGGGEVWVFAQVVVSSAVWLLFARRRDNLVERLVASLDGA